MLAALYHRFIINILSKAKEGVIKYDDGREKTVIYVVLELATGGLLFDYISETGKFRERLTRYYFRQMIEGVHHIH